MQIKGKCAFAVCNKGLCVY